MVLPRLLCLAVTALMFLHLCPTQALQCSLLPSSGHGPHPSAAWDVVLDDESFQPLLPGCLSEPSRQQLLAVLSRQGQGATTATPATATATGATGATASLHELLDVLLRLYLEHQRAQASA